MTNSHLHLFHTLKFGTRGLRIILLSIKLYDILKVYNDWIKSVHSVTECMICHLICWVYGNMANNALCDTVHRFYQSLFTFKMSYSFMDRSIICRPLIPNFKLTEQ
jgi:hypothetical protein